MKADEFCNIVNGKPWVNRGEDIYTGVDCWGLVVASFRHVDGVELPILTGYTDKECSTERAGEEAKRLNIFQQSQATNGAVMVVMNNRGLITHVGRCLCGRVLHATKSMGARWDTYQSISNQFKNVRYYRYAAN